MRGEERSALPRRRARVEELQAAAARLTSGRLSDIQWLVRYGENGACEAFFFTRQEIIRKGW